MRPQIRISPLSCAALLAVCQFIVLVPLLSVYPIGGSSEAREAQIADLIVRSGEWLIPLRNGLAPSKPPLFHWIAALFGSVSGGVTPFIARAVSLLFASGVVFLSSLLTLRACEAGSESLRRNKHTLAIFSAIVLTTTFGYVNMAGDARVDMTYCFFFCLALFPFFSACSADSLSGLSLLEIRKPWRWNLFFISMGLGVLAKGPIAVVLPSVIVFCVLWSCFSWREALRAMSKPRLGWVYFAALAVPWYVLLFFRGGDSILQRQLFFENIQRFMGGAEVNSQPFWYYVPEFLRTALPWSVLFVAMLPEFFSYMRRPYVQAEPYAGLRAIRQSYALWFWVGFLFLSIASGKRQSYLLPLFPAMAVFLSLRGFKFYSEMSDRSRARLLTVSRAALQVLFALLLIVAACFDFLRFAPPLQFGLKSEVLLFLGQFALRIEVLLLALAALLAATFWVGRTGVLLKGFAVYAALLGLLGTAVYTGLAIKNHLKGFDRAGQEIMTTVPVDAPLVVVREPRFEFFDPLLYYLPRPLVLRPWQEAAELCPGYLVVRDVDLQKMQGTAEFEELRRFNPLDKRYAGKFADQFQLIRCKPLSKGS